MNLQFINIKEFEPERSGNKTDLRLSYETFGQSKGNAPTVVVVHALTGNSTVAGDKGWWNTLFRVGGLFDLDRFHVISFNIPGNTYDGWVLDDYKQFTTRDIARLFYTGLQQEGYSQLDFAIGGSLGGAVLWELVAEYPSFVKTFVPVATDWKTTDWVQAKCFVQDSILNNSSHGLKDARMMAMLFYRTPQNFTEKFDRSINEGKQIPNVSSWLEHHGNRLEERFSKSAYLVMNYLLNSIDVAKNSETFEARMQNNPTKIIQIGIDSDIFFVPQENIKTHERLLKIGVDSHYYEIKSNAGHDAFLIEFEQLEGILLKIIKKIQ